MNRRNTVLALLAPAALAVWPTHSFAQTGKQRRVGGMFFPDEKLSTPYAQAMLAGLRDLSYEPGRNLIVGIRYAIGASLVVNADAART